MIGVGDRVRIHRSHTRINGTVGEVIHVQVIAPSPGITSSHLPISRLFTVRLDDGTVVEPPLLGSDLKLARASSQL